MFILSLTYVAPLDAVDAEMDAHVAWLKTHLAAGTFAAGGRRVPRTGGIIVATGRDRAAIEAIAAADPFVTSGVATCEVIEVATSLVGHGFEALKP